MTLVARNLHDAGYRPESGGGAISFESRVLERRPRGTPVFPTNAVHDELTWELASDWLRQCTTTVTVSHVGYVTMFLDRASEPAEALRLLDAWYDTPDSRGSAYWDDLADELARQRFRLR